MIYATFERLRKRAPHLRTEQRERAFYVDPTKDLSWSRPNDVRASEAEDVIVHARNDYWQYRSPGMPGLEYDIDALTAALAAWTDKPPLPPIDWTETL
jgi:hypothetical protein